jgi:hypothetical protein
MRFRILLIPLLFVSAIIGCSRDRWEGYVYPNKNNLNNYIYVGEYQSIEACRDAATAKLEEIGASIRGDYECGKNCRTGAGLKICEETSG